jgi:hypothetical protein
VRRARLLKRDMLGGVAHEQHRQEERDERDDGAAPDQHVARRVLGREPAAHNGREGDAAVAGRLVQPERQPTPLRPDEVDLHDDRHRPGETLVHTEQRVGRDHPAPVRRDGDQ